MQFTNKLDTYFRLKEFSQPSNSDTIDSFIKDQQDSSIFMEREVNSSIGPKQSLFISVSKKISLDELIIAENKLTDSEIIAVLERWDGLLRQHHIMVLFTEKPIDHRRRYRFLSESFFEMQLPVHPTEMYFCFIYDFAESSASDFLSNQTIKTIIQAILNNEYVESIQQLNKRVRLNAFENLSEPEFYYIINKHKQRSNHIINRNIAVISNKIRGNRLIYSGIHETDFCFDDDCVMSKGNWQLEMLAEQGSWRVVDIQVEGVNF